MKKINEYIIAVSFIFANLGSSMILVGASYRNNDVQPNPSENSSSSDLPVIREDPIVDETKINMFSYGLLAVKNDGKYGYIDKNGQKIINFIFEKAYPFQKNGLAIVIDKDTKKYGFINRSGKYAIAPIYERIAPFVNPVTHEINTLTMFTLDGKVGYIDRLGNEKIAPQYIDASYFYRGVAFACREYGQWQLIDEDGNNLSTKLYSSVTYFANNLAAVSDENGFFYIDTAGHELINNRFDYAEPFFDKIGLVRTKDGYTYIDENGNYLSNHFFDQASSFIENRQYAKVSKYNLFGFVNRQNVVFIPLKYRSASNFVAGHAIVENESKQFGLVNQIDRVITGFTYDQIIRTEDNHYLAKKDNRISLLSSDGQVVFTTTEYTNIGYFYGDFAYAVNRDSETTVIDLNNQQQMRLTEDLIPALSYVTDDEYLALYCSTSNKIKLVNLNNQLVGYYENIIPQYSAFYDNYVINSELTEISNYLNFFNYINHFLFV